MGELTSEAASKPPLRLSVGLMRGHPSPSSSPLPGFSVFSMPFYRHQSVWRGDTTRPVSPGVGPWICEIGKLSVSLPSSILHFPRFLLSCFFHHASKPSSSPPRRGTKGQSGSLEYSEEYVDTWRRIISSSFNFQFSRRPTGRKNRAICFRTVWTEYIQSLKVFRIQGLRAVFE